MQYDEMEKATWGVTLLSFSCNVTHHCFSYVYEHGQSQINILKECFSPNKYAIHIDMYICIHMYICTHACNS